MYGESEGDWVIGASCPSAPVAEPTNTTVAVANEWDYRSNPSIETEVLAPAAGNFIASRRKATFHIVALDPDERKQKESSRS